jgi:hypothetical protein
MRDIKERRVKKYYTVVVIAIIFTERSRWRALTLGERRR